MHGGELTFEGNRNSKLFQMLGGKSQNAIMHRELSGGRRFIAFYSIKLVRAIERRLGILTRLGHPNFCKTVLVFGSMLFGSLFSTFAVLRTQQRCSRSLLQTSPTAFQKPFDSLGCTEDSFG